METTSSTDSNFENTNQPRGRARQLQKIPLVRIRKDPEEGLRLIETGRPEWVATSTVQLRYGVEPTRLRDFRVTGDSMSGTIQPGDRIRTLLSGSRPPNDGTIAILRGPTCLLMRRVRLDGTEVVLVADNPDVADLRIDQEEWESDYEQIAHVLKVRKSV